MWCPSSLARLNSEAIARYNRAVRAAKVKAHRAARGLPPGTD